MAYNSLGAFCNFLEERGDLKRVRFPIDPHLEVTEIADRLAKRGGPALLFENVKGSSFPLLINVFGTEKRCAWALGVEHLDALSDELEILLRSQPPGTLMEKIKMIPKLAQISRLLPRRIGSGPCQECRIEPVDLTRLPVLQCWPKDGGRFITFGMVITEDPDNKARNVGIYRMQILDGASTAMHWQIHKVGARHFRRYKELRRRMPVAVAIGGDPSLIWSACAPTPDGVDEFLLASWVRRKSVDLVKCLSNDLCVPADADFVLEGYVDPSEEMVTEGPFGDHTGYYTPQEPFPRFHVTVMTHRKNPIYFTTIVGRPPMEDGWMGQAIVKIFRPALKMILPELVDINIPTVGCFHNLAIISIKKQYPGHAKKVMHGLWGMGQLAFTKCFIVVDHDVNVKDLYEVAWRVSNNIDPKRDTLFVEGPVDHLDHSAPRQFVGSKMGIDATRKWLEEEHYRPWPEDATMDSETKKRIDSLWPNLGL